VINNKDTNIDLGGKRVLVLGRVPEVMEAVVEELTALGLAVEGSTAPEQATEDFDARNFDLIAFGGGVLGPLREDLRRRFAVQNPRVDFLDTYAPRAAWQIAEALKGRNAVASVDLDAYLTRIGYDGPRAPTLATLRTLQELHLAAIPFEAIDVLLGKGIDISPAAVDAKLIHAGRGGYCFEHNGLFARVLTALGFKVDTLLGRVRWLAPAGSPAWPRTHMALQVTVDEEAWLVDVGFGACVPTSPLRIDSREPQPTRHETFRVIGFGAPLLVQGRLGEVWAPLYEMPRSPQLEVDCEVGNWFASTHPSSHFGTELIAARVTPEARFTLLNGRLTIRKPRGDVERRFLDAAGIEAVLSDIFRLPVAAEWRQAIERAASQAYIDF
jgi:N-hydroxyarylamine O-acetyltransferase